jgi:hypothetical protein
VVALVQAGVLTGARKTIHPGKVVGTAFHPLLSSSVSIFEGTSRLERLFFTKGVEDSVAQMARVKDDGISAWLRCPAEGRVGFA